jgi:hypothetical protein
MKRVHWKLTAKKQEWLVKNFQANALNQITVILDTTRFYYTPELNLTMEDEMIEFTLGIVHYCLTNAMPVGFVTGRGLKRDGRNLSDFDGIYHMTAAIPFDIIPMEQNALTLLSRAIDESQNYINVVVVTAKPDEYLYERIVTANHAGHFVALVYIAPPRPDAMEEDIYRMLEESGIACYKVSVAA